MEDNSPLNQGIVFPPWKKHRTIRGIRGSNLKKVIAVVVVSLILFGLLGLVKTTGEVELSASERTIAQQQLVELKSAVTHYETLSEEADTTDMEELGLEEEEIARIEEAQKKGITAKTTNEELSRMVPETKTEQTELFPTVPRLFVVFLLPTLLTIMWHFEIGHGWSMSSAYKDFKRFRKRQKYYASYRKHYLYGDKK